MFKGPKPRLPTAFGHIYSNDGRTISPNIVDAARTSFNNALCKVKPAANVSLHDLLQRAIKNEEMKVERHEAEDAHLVQGALMLAMRQFLGDDLKLVSSEQLSARMVIPGGQLNFPEGGTSLLEPLLRDLPPDTLLLKQPVCTVRWGDALASEDSARAMVICCTGQVFSADYIVCTLPLGVLKEYSPRLFPNLPAQKTEAIAKLGMGRVNALCLEFEKPFWVPVEDGEVVQFAFGTKEQTPETEMKWWHSLTGLKEIPGNSQTLHGIVAGPGAKLLEDIKEDQIAEDVVQVLRQHTGNPLIPPPKNVVRSTWCSDPKFLGGTSFLGVEARIDHIHNLATPLVDQEGENNPVILFAGEATNETHLGTLHGAQLSGMREADRLISIVRMQQETEQAAQQIRSPETEMSVNMR
ncbi:hypothetical protein B566_EDAN002739 [Ephemera danica]|nr:hypothetical protein B566_EDAN002739 [Ephemera danica]